MRCFYAALIAAAVILFIVLLVILCIHLRRKWACAKIAAMVCEKKIEVLDEALTPFGFLYQCRGELVTSGMYSWQREMGYCRQYDEAAIAMHMNFDCEPIYFEYKGSYWLLEIWKGQYGCTTGAEIGLYVNHTGRPGARPSELFYECAGDEERLNMQFTLWKNRVPLMERGGLHWWLTGFCVGEYSTPRELFMQVSICFPNTEMRNAFYEGLLRAGYKPAEIRLDQCCVSICFDRPRTPQPRGYCGCYRRYINWRNKRYCKLFRRVTRRFRCTLDRILYIGYCFPCLFRKIRRLGIRCTPRKLRKFARRKCRG